MRDIETRLQVCLEALREGRWDVEACLRAFPQDAAELRPLLLAAMEMEDAFAAVQPREGFAAAARERFLIATGQRLQEAMDHEPEPSFFAAARVRFLMAAHRMRQAEAAPRSAGRRLLPGFFSRHYRPLAAGLAAMVLLLSGSTYTVASASAADPGEWLYPVKLQTERVRLALAFSDGAERSVKLDLAEERAHEIEHLTRRGKIIGPGVIDRLVQQTQPLIDDAGAGWDTQDVARLESVVERQKTALSVAQPQLDPDAQAAAAAAVDLTQKGVVVTNEILSQRPDRAPAVVTPSVPLSLQPTVTSTEQPPTDTPLASPTAEPSSSTAVPSATPRTSQTPAPALTPGGTTIGVGQTPEGTRGGIIWVRLVVGRLTTLIPSNSNGWTIVGIDVADGPRPAPSLVRLSNADGTSLVTINPRNGDMYWFITRGNLFDEIQMRMQQPDGSVNVIDEEYIKTVYGDAAEIPIYILRQIELAPVPTPTPEPLTPTDIPLVAP